MGPAGTPVVRAVNRLGFRLLACLADQAGGRNVLLSPWSVAVALALVHDGASGATARALAAGLDLAGTGRDEVNRDFETLRRRLEAPAGGVEVAGAVSLWADERRPPQPGFVARARAYDAEVRAVRFADPAAAAAINAWAADRTRGRIAALLTRNDLGPGTLLVLLATVALRGVWTFRFDPALTAAGTWTPAGGASLTVPMMRRAGRLPYHETDRFQAASLPYGDRRLTMDLLRPRGDEAPAALAGELGADGWGGWVQALAEAGASIRMPRFTVRCDADLREPLEALGMGALFDPAADFRPMLGGDGSLSVVRHSAQVEVDESGTEAAAGTAVVAGRSLRPRGPALDLDRPFCFAIRDTGTGILLFLGIVERPDPGGPP